MRTRVRIKGTRDYVTPPLGQATQLGAPRMDAGDAGPLDLGVSGLPVPTDAQRPFETSNGRGRRSVSFRPASWGPNSAIAYGLQDLRNQSRDLYRKNGLAKSAVDNIVTNIIGDGIKPKSLASDEGFRNAFDAAFLAWTDEADASGVLDFYGLQSLAVAGMVQGGETFTRLRARRLNDGLTVPLQLQVMEGEQCPHGWDNLTTITGSVAAPDPSNVIKMGIEYNQIDQRVAYWLYPQHPGDFLVTQTNMTLSRVPASQIAHLFRPGRPGLNRGEPWISAAIALIYDYGKYLDAELVRKKTSSLFVGFVKKVADLNAAMGSQDADDSGTSSLVMEPGSIQVLDDDEEMQFSDPKDTGSNFELFMREIKRTVAVATGNLYELLSGDMSQLNDRTMRAAFNNFKRAVSMWQHQLVVFQWSRPILKQWMDFALMSGALVIPRGMDPKDAYKFDHVPDGWEYIHPVQDVEGKILQIQSGLGSRMQIVAAQGDDASTIDKQNQADNKRADEMKLVYTSDGRRGATNPATQQASAPTIQGGNKDA